MEETIRIAIVQPSSVPEKEPFERGLEILRERGISFKSFVDFKEDSPSQKAFLLYEVMTSGAFTHLWCARGGSGAIKLLPFLEELFQSTKKIPSLPQIIGFSDITTLHLYFYKKFRLIGLHAPMIVNLPTITRKSLERTFEILFKKQKTFKMTGKAFQRGSAKGILIGGNLMTLSSLCGTPFFPEEKEIILFLEETKEPLYRIERALLQILLSLPKGVLKGLIFGDLGEVKGENLLERLSEFFPEGIPLAYDFPIGHTSRNYPFLIGVRAELKVSSKRARLCFSYS